MIRSIGIIKYYDRNKINILVDVDLGRLAMALIPPWLNPRQTRYPPHITVLRNEGNICHHDWGKYDNWMISFSYDPEIKFDNTYFWHAAVCPMANSIRKNLGLNPTTDLTRPPDGSDFMHITVANRKRNV